LVLNSADVIGDELAALDSDAWAAVSRRPYAERFREFAP
jgi:hypothetical protein